MNSTLLTTERLVESPNSPRVPESTPEPERSVAAGLPLSACDPEDEQRQAAAERRDAQLAAQRARAEYEAFRASYLSTPRLF